MSEKVIIFRDSVEGPDDYGTIYREDVTAYLISGEHGPLLDILVTVNGEERINCKGVTVSEAKAMKRPDDVVFGYGNLDDALMGDIQYLDNVVDVVLRSAHCPVCEAPGCKE